MAARPNVNVFSRTEKKIVGTVPLPAVFETPIRSDVVQFVHTNVAKNARQSYAVTRRQGHRTTAESWGTGRAVARIPRVSGGGTNRSGQGAYGNQCRGGHMASATKTFRRWHRHVNKNQRRLAVISAIAATAVPGLVMSRGHKIDSVPEIPLVIDDSIATLNKTKEAVAFLKTIQALNDVEKVDASRHVRPTKGKWRNRRYVSRKGPLVILDSRAGSNAFANIRGVDVANVNFLNLLQLAPGGHLGRFVIWSKKAFEALNNIYGTTTKVSAVKAGFQLPKPIVKNTDIGRVINSAEIQKVCRRKLKGFRSPRTNVNPLRKRSVLKALSPYATVLLHNQHVAERARAKATAARRKARRAEVKTRRASLLKSKEANKAPAAKAPKAPAKAAAKPAAKKAGK
eukprot:PhF_6_TR4980/c0_g1_i1/m.7048/K02930/RP-L4e, RPL4; large subunit ribosomal protein L4e